MWLTLWAISPQFLSCFLEFFHTLTKFLTTIYFYFFPLLILFFSLLSIFLNFSGFFYFSFSLTILFFLFYNTWTTSESGWRNVVAEIVFLCIFTLFNFGLFIFRLKLFMLRPYNWLPVFYALKLSAFFPIITITDCVWSSVPSS
jgi:hypothetical protein